MCIGLLGTKIGITQIFNTEGNFIPITIIKCGPCYITQIKNLKNCGYNAIQIGYLEKVKNKERSNLFHFLKEYKIKNVSDYEINQKIDVSIFEKNEFVNISSMSIGKGYAGNIKRNNLKINKKFFRKNDIKFGNASPKKLKKKFNIVPNTNDETIINTMIDNKFF